MRKVTVYRPEVGFPTESEKMRTAVRRPRRLLEWNEVAKRFGGRIGQEGGYLYCWGLTVYEQGGRYTLVRGTTGEVCEWRGTLLFDIPAGVVKAFCADPLERPAAPVKDLPEPELTWCFGRRAWWTTRCPDGLQKVATFAGGPLGGQRHGVPVCAEGRGPAFVRAHLKGGVEWYAIKRLTKRTYTWIEP